MANTNHLNILFLPSEKLTNSFRLHLNRTSRSFLHENISINSMLKSKKDKINRFIQTHDKTGHRWLRESNRKSCSNLFDPKRDNGTAGTHHVTVTRTTNFRFIRIALPTLGNSHLFLDSLSDPHRIYRVCGLIRGKADNTLHPTLDCCSQHVIRPDHVRSNSLHRKKLT